MMMFLRELFSLKCFINGSIASDPILMISKKDSFLVFLLCKELIKSSIEVI